MRKVDAIRLFMALVIGANCCFYSGCSDGKVRDDSDHSETAKEGSRETTTVTSETETETEATTVTTAEETTETVLTPTPAPTLSDEAAVVLSDVVQRSYLNFLYRDASPEEADAIVSATRNDPESLNLFIRDMYCSVEFVGSDYLVDNNNFVFKLYNALLNRNPSLDEVSECCSIIEQYPYNGRTAAVEHILTSEEWKSIWQGYGLDINTEQLNVYPDGTMILDHRYHPEDYQLEGTLPDGEYEVLITGFGENNCQVVVQQAVIIEDSAVLTLIPDGGSVYLSLAGDFDVIAERPRYDEYGCAISTDDAYFNFSKYPEDGSWTLLEASDWTRLYTLGTVTLEISDSYSGTVTNYISLNEYQFTDLQEYYGFYCSYAPEERAHIVVENGQIVSSSNYCLWSESQEG